MVVVMCYIVFVGSWDALAYLGRLAHVTMVGTRLV